MSAVRSLGQVSSSAEEKEHNIILQTKQPTFSLKNVNIVKASLLLNINKKMYTNNPTSMHHYSFIQNKFVCIETFWKFYEKHLD